MEGKREGINEKGKDYPKYYQIATYHTHNLTWYVTNSN